jgi:hypothetical protein
VAERFKDMSSVMHMSVLTHVQNNSQHTFGAASNGKLGRAAHKHGVTRRSSSGRFTASGVIFGVFEKQGVSNTVYDAHWNQNHGLSMHRYEP